MKSGSIASPSPAGANAISGALTQNVATVLNLMKVEPGEELGVKASIGYGSDDSMVYARVAKGLKSVA